MRTLDVVVMLVLLGQVLRLWWQVNRGRVSHWPQRVKITGPGITRCLKIFMQSGLEARNSLIQRAKWNA